MRTKPATVVALYPGSFDPITNGHLDLIQRGSALFDKLIVSILRNEEKKVLFSVADRIEMLNEVTCGLHNVQVGSFDGLRLGGNISGLVPPSIEGRLRKRLLLGEP